MNRLYITLLLGLCSHFLFAQANNDAIQHLNKGIEYMDHKNYDRAIASFSMAIQKDYKFYKAFYYRGLANYNQKKYDKAKIDFKKVKKTNEYPKAYLYLGKIAMHNKRYRSAIKNLTKAQELMDDPKESITNRGLCYFKLKKYDQAIADFTYQIDNGFGTETTYYNRALCYYNTQKHREAIMDFNELKKPTLKTKTLMAKSFYQLKKYEITINTLEDVLADKKDATLLLIRAVCHIKLNNEAEAKQDFDQILLLQPNHKKALKYNATASIKAKDYDNAAKYYDGLIKNRIDLLKSYTNRGICSIKIKDYEHAVNDFSKAIKLNPKDGKLYYNRASAYVKLKQKAEACEDMRSAAKNGYTKAIQHIRALCKE